MCSRFFPLVDLWAMPGTPLVLSDGPGYRSRIVKMQITRGITDDWAGVGTWDPAVWWDRHDDLKPIRDSIILFLQGMHRDPVGQHHPKKINLAGAAALRLRLMCAVRVDSNINIRQIVGHLGAIDWYLDSAHVLCTEEFLKEVPYPPWTPLMLPDGHKLGINGLLPSLYEDISVEHKFPDGIFNPDVPYDKEKMRKFSCLQASNFYNDATRINVGASDYGQFLYLELPDTPQERRLRELHEYQASGQAGEDAARILEEMQEL